MVAIARRTIHLYDGELAKLIEAAFMAPGEQQALIAAFEDTFARHLGVRHAIAVGSGRLGLRLILQSLDIGEGDSVLLPAYTDQSVPNAIRKVGAEPSYLRIDRGTHNIDPNRLSDALKPCSKALIATHLFGAPCDMGAMKTFANKHNLFLLEDCAHAIDSKFNGEQCGTIGRASIFSFVVTKAVNTFGGGLVATNDTVLANKIREHLQNLPTPDPIALMRRIVAGYAINTVTGPRMFEWVGLPLLRSMNLAGNDVIGVYNRFVRPATINANVDTAFSAIQAAAGLQQIRNLEATQARRIAIARKIVRAAPAHLSFQAQRTTDQHSFYFSVCTTERPDRVAAKLMDMNVDVGRFPMRNCAALDDPETGPAEFSNTQYLYDHSIQLPVYPELSDESVEHIIRSLHKSL